MLLRWLHSNDTFSTFDESLPSSILTPRDMEERRRILDAVNTKSIWTSDLVWQLQKWKLYDKKRFQFVLISKNVSTADQEYENFEYYQQSFSDDQDRVCWTFTELHRQAVPMMESSHFPLSTVLHVTSRYKDVVAMLLVDNSILRNRQEQLDVHPNASSATAYAGHYVILCGTSDDPQHVEKANRVRPDNNIATQSLTDTSFGVCCVLANPDPASPSPLEFVMPDHLEAAWRSKGTDDDIIFLRKLL
ncbi:guanylylate cyclase [Nitzschia inconspicua]|uniref:Guanylylate cyclase n=1 Tax=Nitzschia inconspicua TaxID=303405 RepID=A0A9K3KIF6_9STRA|nr:guanylylate cyclase [Nitzschia inconspicua]